MTRFGSQVPVDTDGMLITVINTCWGRWCVPHGSTDAHIRT